MCGCVSHLMFVDVYMRMRASVIICLYLHVCVRVCLHMCAHL